MAIPIILVGAGVVAVATAIGVVAISWTIEDMKEIVETPAGQTFTFSLALLGAALAMQIFKGKS